MITRPRPRAAIVCHGHFDQAGDPVAWAFAVPPGQPSVPLFDIDDDGNRLFAGWTAAELKSYYIAVRSQ